MPHYVRPTAAPHIQGRHSRGYLPHIKIAGATYFVTFRLADSLPREVLDQIEAELGAMQSGLQADSQTALDRGRLEACATRCRSVERTRRHRMEAALDQGAGACHLRQPESARLVADALQHFHPARYLLHAWVVMPNHVHALLTPLVHHALGEIVKTWKQFSSRRVKQRLGLDAERFWQPEAYDHWVRNEIEHERIARYIHQNPVKARLCLHPEDWPWSSAARTGAPFCKTIA